MMGSPALPSLTLFILSFCASVLRLFLCALFTYQHMLDRVVLCSLLAMLPVAWTSLRSSSSTGRWTMSGRLRCTATALRGARCLLCAPALTTPLVRAYCASCF